MKLVCIRFISYRTWCGIGSVELCIIYIYNNKILLFIWFILPFVNPRLDGKDKGCYQYVILLYQVFRHLSIRLANHCMNAHMRKTCFSGWTYVIFHRQKRSSLAALWELGTLWHVLFFQINLCINVAQKNRKPSWWLSSGRLFLCERTICKQFLLKLPTLASWEPWVACQKY